MSLTATPVQLFQAKVPAARTSMGSLSTDKKIVKEILLCNTSNSLVTVTIYVVPDGATFDAIQHTVFSLEMAKGETKILSLSLVLESNTALQMEASTADVVGAHGSGVLMEVVV